MTLLLTEPAVGGQLTLDGYEREIEISAIHQATGIYTAMPEIETLLDRLRWPERGHRLLDPGAGNGGFLVAALQRLPLERDDVDEAVCKVRGYEFYSGAVADARSAVYAHLAGRGWSSGKAQQAATLIVENRDFLLSPVPAGVFDVIATNPPYWRLSNLPPGYRAEYERIVLPHARADLLYAYLQRSADIAAPGARIGLITADRWLLNSGSAELRRRLGAIYRVADVHRLDARSVFYRPKQRKAGTPARVHPVTLILTPDSRGRVLTQEPFRLTELPAIDGVPLPAIAEIRLAPWLGPDGVFTVDGSSSLPRECLVPVVEPEDLTGETIQPPRRWAIVTTAHESPPSDVLAHLDAGLHRMPPRGRRAIRWLPPETFTGRLPLSEDAVLVPRIRTRLEPLLLPAGRLPVNHNLAVVSGLPAPVLIRMLNDPVVQEQADALALHLENGYRSYTSTLLRHLIIPRRLVTSGPCYAMAGRGIAAR